MSKRCEPPPELRDRFGTHWVVRRDEARGDLTPILCNWEISNGAGGWEWGEIHEDLGWRYLAPVTPPAVVAALVEALKKCADDLEARVMREYSVGILTPGVALRQAEDLAPVDAARAALALYREAGR